MFSYIKNQLHCESVSLTEVAEIYDTPLYVYSQQEIIDNYQAFSKGFGDKDNMICYAVKANSNLAVLATLAKQGAGFDVVSMGELSRVQAAGGRAEKCVFSGVAKTQTEIAYALEAGIYCFNVESASELLRIESVAKELGKIAPISIRINPDVDAKTHPYISTGLKDNKFGVDIIDALALYKKAQSLNHVSIEGIDCHIGSQITQPQPFLDALDRVLLLVDELKSQGINLNHIDLGGGVGIVYEDTDCPFDTQAYLDAIIEKTQGYQIILEPGRAIVGNAGVLITQVEFLKQNAHKSFAIVDAAMNDLLRPALYQAYHDVLPLEKNNNGTKAHWDLVGPICETGDFLAKDRELCLSYGDKLAVMSAGAYGFVMSSNYNTRPRVAEVMVHNDQHRLVRKREDVKSLFKDEFL